MNNWLLSSRARIQHNASDTTKIYKTSSTISIGEYNCNDDPWNKFCCLTHVSDEYTRQLSQFIQEKIWQIVNRKRKADAINDKIEMNDLEIAVIPVLVEWGCTLSWRRGMYSESRLAELSAKIKAAAVKNWGFSENPSSTVVKGAASYRLFIKRLGRVRRVFVP